MDRREFMKGAALGVGAGVLGSMGLYSYSPLRRAFLPEVKRGTADIGVCKSVKVTNISETSWFDNGIFMNDVTGAGGLLVDQYTFNWAPFGNGKGVGKGTFEEGLKRIKHLLPHKIDEAWAIAKENCVHADNAGGYSCLVEIESMEGETTRYLFDTGWNYDWMDTCFKREGIDVMLADNKIDAFIQTHEHMDHYWGFPVVTKYNPNIHVYTPNTFYPAGKEYLKACGHVGKWTEVPKGLHTLQPGVALYQFDCPIIFKVFGEMSLYCNVKGRGLGEHHRLLPSGDHPLRGHGLQGACLREGSVLRTVRRAAYLALRRLGPEVRRPRHRAQEVEPPAGRLQPLHGPHHRPEVRGRGLSGGEGHGPVPLQDHQLPRQRRRHQVPRLR